MSSQIEIFYRIMGNYPGRGWLIHTSRVDCLKHARTEVKTLNGLKYSKEVGLRFKVKEVIQIVRDI